MNDSRNHNLKGGALLEFSIALPLLIVLVFGGIEVMNMIRSKRKLETIAYSMGQTANTLYSMSNTDRDNFLWATVLNGVSAPFSPSIISGRIYAFKKLSGNLQTLWTSHSPGDSGTVDPATLTNWQVEEGQNIVVIDIFLNYTPILGAPFGISKTYSSRMVHYMSQSIALTPTPTPTQTNTPLPTATITPNPTSTPTASPTTLSSVTISSISFSPNPMPNNSTSLGTLTLTGPAPTGGLTIYLISSKPSVVVPSTVFFSAGQVTLTFYATSGGADVTSTITASGAGKKNTGLTVQ